MVGGTCTRIPRVFKSAQRPTLWGIDSSGNKTRGCFVEQVSATEFARLSKSNIEMSDHIVVLTAIVGAMATTASVDYERLKDCVSFAMKRYRAGRRPALLKRASSVLHDLEAMQKVIGVENRKRRNSRKRSVAALARQTL
jgi:hypothetical protein